VNGAGTFTLTESEQSQLAATADELTRTPPHLVDESSWVSACRTLSSRLPGRLRERLREFQYDSKEDGVLLLRNLPVGTGSLPSTPMVAESVEKTASTGASAIALISMQLGEIIAYRNEKAGAIIQNVVPVPGREDQQSNAGSAALQMHVENAFHPRRPDYVALLCVRSDHEHEAGLRVASIRRALGKLSDQTRQVLGEARFATDPPPSFGTPGAADAASRHAVLDGDPDDPDVRIDFNSSRPLDDGAAAAVDELRDLFETVIETIWLAPGHLAVLDNRIALHGRTCFKPRYDGRDRWLHRTFIEVDNRASRAVRAGGGHVIS
jgi:L-asparagine oxygenase